MNEYSTPTTPNPQQQQVPGAYPNPPQPWGSNQPGQYDPQMMQPHPYPPGQQGIPLAAVPSEAAAKPKRPILLLCVLIFTILMPVLRLTEIIVMVSMVDTVTYTLRQYLGDDAYQQFMMSSGSSDFQTLQAILVSRIFVGTFFSLVYVIFGIFIFLGHNWARIVLTVFTVLNTLLAALLIMGSLLDYSMIHEYTDFVDLRGYNLWFIVIYISILLLGLVPLILMWLPPVNRFVRQRALVRQAQQMRNNPYGMRPGMPFPQPVPQMPVAQQYPQQAPAANPAPQPGQGSGNPGA